MFCDYEAIRWIYERSARALDEGDLDALPEIYAEDAVQQPPDRAPIEGLRAISAAVAQETRGRHLHSRVEIEEIHGAHGWAFAAGTYAIEVDSDSLFAHARTGGHWLDILRRQPDGTWRIVRSTWSHEPAMS